MASHHTTLFGKGPFWSMCWVSFQANLPVFHRADLLCFHKVCNLIESVLQSQNKIHKDKPWYQTNQLRRDGNLGMTFLVLTVHEACYQVWNHSDSVYILQVLVAVSAWFWTGQSLAQLSRQGQVGPFFDSERKVGVHKKVVHQWIVLESSVGGVDRIKPGREALSNKGSCHMMNDFVKLCDTQIM